MVKLILGCWGLENKDFIICPGVENEILDLSKDNEINIEIKNYLDSVGLFDRPLFNNIHTVIFNMQNKFSYINNPVFTKDEFTNMEKFCIMHRKCGIFLKLTLREIK